ncbi:MAG: hypothetical protein ABI361_01855 [Nitrososphaera sp.]
MEYLVASCGPAENPVAEQTELVTIRNFRREKDHLKKNNRKGIAIELLISDARRLAGRALGDWFAQAGELYDFCNLRGDQFILSSGATSLHEMVSGQCMDAVLVRCGINPKRHWRRSADWLDETLAKRIVGVAA